MPLEVAEQLWRLLGFPHTAPDDVAFTPADVEALRSTKDLMELGILGTESQSALVRTWGRSFARLAEWETRILADLALRAGAEPATQLASLAVLAEQVLPRVDLLQGYIWRRHLASATSRLLAVESSASPALSLAVCFVDIVGYTSQSKAMAEAELVEWIERFEDTVSGFVTDGGGRIIKNIGDEVLFVADDASAAAEIALGLTALGADPDDPFPAVRAGISCGEVVSRLGDVFGPTVNIAARLTSIARPGAVLVDRGAYESLSGLEDDRSDSPESDPGTSPYLFRRMRRTSVKGYSRLQSWVLHRRDVA